ncbi:MAG TPA: T9SS type A sorting domain-containing protein, partial [Membranihabitans sp.]|nr:T9SS type A sorting domain-containing protein [Membranihabitans sp.]
SGSLGMTSENYAVLPEGRLTASWFDIVEHHLTDHQVLFYIIVKTKRQLTLKDVVRNTADVLLTESYVEPGLVQGLDFTFREIKGTLSHIHNRPNPFKEHTVVYFELDRSGPVDIQIHDVTGKSILQRKIEGAKGKNETIFQGADFPGPGMYYYRIVTPDQQWTNKMIFIQ